MFSPTSELRLLENVKIGVDYNHTYTFTNATTQASFFIGLQKYLISDFTFIRKNNSIKVPYNVETLWTCNYLMFKNTNFGSKYFYAFITDMQYVNDDTTEIFFEIDVMQTWKFEINYKNCLVEREHVSDDTIGLHTIPENLNIGDYIVKTETKYNEPNDIGVYILSVYDEFGTDVTPSGYIQDGTYCGLGVFLTDNRANTNQFIVNLNALGKIAGLYAIYMAPKSFLNNTYSGSSLWQVESNNPTIITKILSKDFGALDGYTPRNNKLHTYPYKLVTLTNYKGGRVDLKQELFSTSNMQFDMSCDMLPNPTAYFMPNNYEGMLYDWEKFITLTGYPFCAWTDDGYKNWLAQNQATNGLSVVGSLVTLGSGLFSANPLAIGGGALSLANTVGNFVDAQNMPSTPRGSLGSQGHIAQDKMEFGVLQKTITSEFAKIIDDYFHRLGYKVASLKNPTFETRQNWNYIKCLEVSLDGNIPQKDLNTIKDNFLKGITFWHDSDVGNYNRSNPILP